MNKYIFVFFLFIFSCQNSISQWVNVTNNINGGNLRTITSDGSVIYVGRFILTGDNLQESPTIYRTSNGGLNWAQTGFTKYALSLFTRNSRVFVSTTNFNGNYYSDNYGVNWSTLNYPYSPYEISAFASNGTYLFASGSSGIERSSDNGNTWVNANLSSSSGPLSVKDNLVITGNGTSIRTSTNNGNNWTSAVISSQVVSVAVNANYLLAGTVNSGVFKSTDNGVSWEQTSLSSHNIQALYTAGDTIIAGDLLGTGVYVSTNRGSSWILRNEGFGTDKSIQGFTNFDNCLYVATTTGVWKRDLHQLVFAKNTSYAVPSAFVLSQNYPNPFNPVTRIKFFVPENEKWKSENGFVTLKVYDILGKEIETLVNERMQAGSYEVTFDGSIYPSGVYFYRLTSGNFVETKKMALIK